MKKTIVIFFCGLLTWSCLGQHKKIRHDSIKKNRTVHYKKPLQSQKDSTAFYEHLRKTTRKHKFTQRLYNWIVRNRSHKKKHEKEPDYTPYTGRVIRHILISSKDPFGYSLTDTTKHPHSWLQKTGDAIHIKSKRQAIEKFVLFDEGAVLDTLLIRETARLLRDQNYIRKVRIVPRPVGAGKDSVDIVVKVIDSWSLIPKVSLSGNDMKLGVGERNFLGFGHRVDLTYGKRFDDGHNAFASRYTIPNIKNSFIDLTGRYAIDYDSYYDGFMAINRPFYSSLAKWAGGILIEAKSLKRPFFKTSNNFVDHDMKYVYQDYWLGHAFHIFKGRSKLDRTTSLVLGFRTYFLNYLESPDASYDPLNYFSDEHFYLGSIGLSSRQYVRDRYIFRDGQIEDVPVGVLYALTAGVQQKNYQSRFYAGLRLAYGNYFKWGLLTGNFELGSFFTHSRAEQTTLSFKLNYMSPLYYLGHDWKLRQFIKPQFVLGFNRLPTMIDRISLNERPYFKGVNSYNYIDYISKERYIDYKTGNIVGFDSPVNGTKKYLLDLQTQFYAPWSFLGFHFNPFVQLSVGYLSGGRHTYGSDKLYSSFGVGFIIRNDYLVFDSFQLSLSFYPSMPGRGHNIIRGNGYKTEDFGFQDFRMRKPRPVIYE